MSLSFSLCMCECLCMCAFTLFKHDSHCLLSLLQLTCCRCLCLCRCQHSALTSLHCFSVEQGDHDAASVVVALAVVVLLPLLLVSFFCFLLLFCVLCHHLAVSCQRRLERVNCYFAAPTLQVPSLGWTSLRPTASLLTALCSFHFTSAYSDFPSLRSRPLFDLVISKCTLSQRKKELSAHSKDLCDARRRSLSLYMCVCVWTSLSMCVSVLRSKNKRISHCFSRRSALSAHLRWMHKTKGQKLHRHRGGMGQLNSIFGCLCA